jgi:hypothetical protein
MKTLLTIVILIVALSFCNKPAEKKNAQTQNTLCSLQFIEDSIGSKIFPFEFRLHNSYKLLTMDFQNVKVDSVEKGDAGNKHWIYSYSDGVSKVQFMVKPNSSNEEWFYLAKAEIKSSIFLNKPPIFVGMNKTSFSKYISAENVSCDTINITAGELSSRYQFIFVNDNLESIRIVPEE